MAQRDTKYARLLLSRGISGMDVAAGTGLDPSQVSLIKNGYKNINILTLKKLCIFHNVSPNEILDWEKWFDEKDKKNAA